MFSLIGFPIRIFRRTEQGETERAFFDAVAVFAVVEQRGAVFSRREIGIALSADFELRLFPAGIFGGRPFHLSVLDVVNGTAADDGREFGAENGPAFMPVRFGDEIQPPAVRTQHNALNQSRFLRMENKPQFRTCGIGFAAVPFPGHFS